MTTSWTLAERVRRSPDGGLITRKSPLGRCWREMSASAFHTQVCEVAAGLVTRGLQLGDVISIMSYMSYEWTLPSLIAWKAGLVTVLIYKISSAEQVQWILTDAGVRLTIVENEAMASMVGALASTVPELESLQVLCVEHEDVLGLIKAGRGVDAGELDRHTAALTSQSLAIIVYASGTTGCPKGVGLSHGNPTHLCISTCLHTPEVLGRDEVCFPLFLLLAHVLGRLMEIAVVYSRASVSEYVPDVRNLLNDPGSSRPTAVLTIPRVFEKAYNATDTRTAGTKQKVFRLAARTVIACSRTLNTPQGPSRRFRAQRAAFNELVFSTLHSTLGGQVTYMVSGSDPLDEHLGHFYHGAGVTIPEGYGLTETMSPCSVNPSQVTRVGTMGTPLPGYSLRLGDGGEILARGIGTFMGYHSNPEATIEVFIDDGWLHTGDIGSLEDTEDFLRITGRKGGLTVTAGGRNVALAPLGDCLRGHPLVSQVPVVGESRPCIGVSLTLDAEMLLLWLPSHGLEKMTVVDAARDPRMRAALEKAVVRTNEAVSRAESIHIFKILPTDFTMVSGLLTPSLKVHRTEAERRFTTEIGALYACAPLIPGTTVSLSQG